MEELVEKVMNLIDEESTQFSTREYKELLEALVDELQTRIEAVEHDLEYSED